MLRNSDRPIKIAFAITGGAGWIAGIHYFQNLFTAIRSVADSAELQLYLLPVPGVTDDDLKLLVPFAAGVLRVPEPAPAKRSFADRIKSRLGFAEPPSDLGSYLRSKKIDYIFSTAEYGPDFPIPVLSWIPDFQHKELPEFFGEVEIRARDTSFGAMVANAHRIVLSSNHAAEVARQYYPDAAAKLRVMPFVAQIPASSFGTSGRETADKYGLPEKFFFLPNQLWKHKNHIVVIEALRFAKEQEPSITVACSGATTDYRDASHFPFLESKIAEFGIENNIRILGMIPEEDVFALMRQSVCILQPSLYEGWSTVVEQAKSMGKPMLLSNLKVHLEQNPPASKFFDPRNPKELSELLVDVYRNGSAGPDLQMEAAAAASLQQRTKDYGRRFLDIVLEK